MRCWRLIPELVEDPLLNPVPRKALDPEKWGCDETVNRIRDLRVGVFGFNPGQARDVFHFRPSLPKRSASFCSRASM